MNAPSPTPAPAPRSLWLAGGGLVVLVAAAYWNSLAGPFVFDDGPAILDNPSVRRLWPLGPVLQPGIDGGVTTSGRPLVNLSLAINHALGGQNVWGYHLFNLLVHAGAGLILFGGVRRTLRQPALAARFGASALPLAAAVAAVWLLHPLQTAAVTYVVQRAESMVSLFYLLTLYAFIRATDLERAEGDQRSRPAASRWFIVSLLACLFGMACKEVMVTAPVMVLLYDRTFVAGGFKAAWARRWRYYVALAATWLLLALLLAGTKGRGGTAGFGIEVSPWAYALTQCGAIIHYLRLIVWPHPLVFDYGSATAGGFADVWWQALLLAALLAGAIWALVRRPVAGFPAAWFFVLLAPSSSVVPVATQTMAEHRLYLALAAPVILLGCTLYGWLGRRAWPVLGLLALAGGALTVARNADYADAHRLWADTAAKRPANARAHHNLGLADLERGRLEEAVGHLRDAIALAPGLSDSRYNLGVVLARLGRLSEAMAAYEETLRIDPAHAGAHNNLANLLSDAGRAAEAGRHYAEAVRLQSRIAGARNSYGKWLIDEGRPAEALVQLEEGIRLDPAMAELRFNAGNACAASGRLEAAAGHYREAIRLRPGHAEAHNNLGNALVELERLPEAIPAYEQAVRLDPAYADPRRNLAVLLTHLGRVPEAVAQLRAYVELRPDDREARTELARLQALARP